MCEKRARKIMKKSSQATRLREARRLERLQRLTITSRPALAISAPAGFPTTEASCLPHPIKFMTRDLQNKVLLELAWKTVHLMQKNRLIQQKIVDLQKETSEYVAKVMSDPQNKQRYSDHVRLYAFGVGVFQKNQVEEKSLKMEPEE